MRYFGRLEVVAVLCVLCGENEAMVMFFLWSENGFVVVYVLVIYFVFYDGIDVFGCSNVCWGENFIIIQLILL